MKLSTIPFVGAVYGSVGMVAGATAHNSVYMYICAAIALLNAWCYLVLKKHEQPEAPP